MAQCVFCRASSENGFNVVFEDKDYIAFEDHTPAAEHHYLVIPRIHVATVKTLDKADVPMLMTMKEIGTRVLDDLGVPPEKRRMGFHIPPFNSINHLHLHLHALPYRNYRTLMKYPIFRGMNGRSKGFSWFVEVDQAIEILEQGKTIGLFPC